MESDDISYGSMSEISVPITENEMGLRKRLTEKRLFEDQSLDERGLPEDMWRDNIPFVRAAHHVIEKAVSKIAQFTADEDCISTNSEKNIRYNKKLVKVTITCITIISTLLFVLWIMNTFIWSIEKEKQRENNIILSPNESEIELRRWGSVELFLTHRKTCRHISPLESKRDVLNINDRSNLIKPSLSNLMNTMKDWSNKNNSGESPICLKMLKINMGHFSEYETICQCIFDNVTMYNPRIMESKSDLAISTMKWAPINYLNEKGVKQKVPRSINITYLVPGTDYESWRTVTGKSAAQIFYTLCVLEGVIDMTGKCIWE